MVAETVVKAETERQAIVARVFSWRTVLLFWLLFSLFVSLPTLLTAPFSERNLSFARALTGNTVCGLVWALVTPLVLVCARSFFISGRRWLAHLLFHICAGGIFSVVQMIFFTIIIRLMEQPSAQLGYWQQLILTINSFFSADVMYYWFVVLTYHALAMLDRLRQGELDAVRIREQLAGARLESLQAKLHPHFLFNTLHTIGSLVRLDRKQPALQTLSELGDLLRHSLDLGDRPLVPLSEELELARKYLAIEQQRFSDRLQVAWRIGPGTEDILVPALVLQPLIENAIRHGLGTSAEAGQLEIVTGLEQDHLRIEVRDDGPGLPAGWSHRDAGIGLTSTRARLAQIYQQRSRLMLANGDQCGAVATIVIPYAGEPVERSLL